MIILGIVAFFLILAGIGLSVYQLIKQGGIHGLYDALKFPLLIAICLFLLALLVSILIKSQYVVDDKYYTTQFGFIKSKFLIKDITALVLNTNNKLTVFCGEEYSVLTIDPKWNHEFIQALRDVNKNIDFSFVLSDEKEDKKKNKK